MAVVEVVETQKERCAPQDSVCCGFKTKEADQA